MSSKFECTLTLNEVYWKSNKATAIKKSPPLGFRRARSVLHCNRKFLALRISKLAAGTLC